MGENLVALAGFYECSSEYLLEQQTTHTEKRLQFREVNFREVNQ